MSQNMINLGEFIEFSIEKRFGIIKLNRIHRSNAFTIEYLNDLKNAIEYCQADSKIKGVILTNNGTSFSTGMDLGEITKYDYTQVKELESIAATICKLLYNGKPAICAVNGRTMGEGVVFLVCCDYKIATKESFFQMPEINSAIFPGTGCVILFSKIIGINWTKKMLMFSEKIGIDLALKIGLIDSIVQDKQELMRLALEKANFLHSKNQIVLHAIKLMSNHLANENFAEAYDIEKKGSDWYKYKDKEQLLKELNDKFEWKT
ncbi:MAG: enoyl-CoA hydratase/isomerase family protein [Candidatus Hermodarchaeota archaeon]